MSPARVLVVAFHFPPIAAAGTHRTLNFVRQLAARGHTIGVVTTASFDNMPVDARLLERVPGGVMVARARHVDPFFLLHRLRSGARSRGATGANGLDLDVAGRIGAGGARPLSHSPPTTVLDYVSRCFDVPDRYASWILPAVLKGIALAKKIGADVLFTTAPPFSAHVVGLALKSVLGLPWIADFRDPWATNPFKVQPYSSLRKVDEMLEAAVIRAADRVVLNTELCERVYRERYPDHVGLRTIPNGIDPELLAPRGAIAPSNGIAGHDGPLHLVHVGTIYGRRSPLGLLEALRRLGDERPDLAVRITIEQLGSVENQRVLEAHAEDLGVTARLRFAPPVSHGEALERSRSATGLLLLGVSGERPEVQVPAKLFEYLAAGRPILALAKAGGAIAQTLATAGAVHLIADPDDPDAIARALALAVEGWPGRPAPAEHPGLMRYRYDRLADRLEAELLSVREPAAHGAPGHRS